MLERRLGFRVSGPELHQSAAGHDPHVGGR
jgi:hypothetical protein